MRLVRRHERVLLIFGGELTMSMLVGGIRGLHGRTTATDERSIRSAAVREAAVSTLFQSPSWRVLVNSPEKPVYAVATGLYPDLVALDGSDAGVAWVMEVAGPSGIAEESAWERWEQMTATGHAVILAVPFGCGRLTEKVAETLGVRVGLVYQYALTPDGVVFCLPHQEMNFGVS